MKTSHGRNQRETEKQRHGGKERVILESPRQQQQQEQEQEQEQAQRQANSHRVREREA